MTETTSGEDTIVLAAEIVAAFVANNSVSTTDLPALITSVHGAIKALGQPAEEVVPELVPAVPIKKSVTPDFIICLEDGKKFKSLKRHLATHFQLTPDEYRSKWNLPSDYPMVAPNYSETRSALAKTNGLGRKPTPAPAKKGRGTKGATG